MKFARIEIRLSEDEKAAWQASASLAGLSLSDWIRTRCSELVRTAHLAPSVQPPPVQPIVRTEPKEESPPRTDNPSPITPSHRRTYVNLCIRCARFNIPACDACKLANPPEQPNPIRK